MDRIKDQQKDLKNQMKLIDQKVEKLKYIGYLKYYIRNNY